MRQDELPKRESRLIAKQAESPPPIYSSLADDEMMLELLATFVGELPDRIEIVENALKERDFELLHRTAHQLKGAFGSYGFSALTEPARRLEMSLASERLDLAAIEREVASLVSDCKRISGSAGTR